MPQALYISSEKHMKVLMNALFAVERNVACPRSESPARAASRRASSPARVEVNTNSDTLLRMSCC